MTGPAGGESRAGPPPLDVEALSRPVNPAARPGRGRPLLLGALLATSFTALIGALSLMQVTSEGPALRSLGRSLAILSQIDAYMDERYDGIEEEAAEDGAESVTLDDLPTTPTVTAAEVTGTDRDGLRDILVARMARAVYDNGSSALRADDGGSTGLVSPEGAVQRGMDLLRPRPHAAFVALTLVLAAAALALTIALLATAQGFGRLAATGGSLALGAGLVVVLAIGLRLLFDAVARASDEYAAREFLDLTQELTWAALRNGLTAAVVGLIVLAVGASLASWARRQA